MNRAMPAVIEDVEFLREQMKKARDSYKLPRLQMLYLLRTGQARNRKEVARVLGINRDTAGDWLAKYESGGIDGLVEIGRSAGATPSISETVIAGIRSKLNEQEGLAGFRDLHKWVEQTYGLQTTYRTIYYHALKLQARLAVPRRSHSKKKLMPR
jgi:DNA-binding CsgD family transcriptional regulator